MANAMECKEAKEKLSEALDAELGDEAQGALNEHLESCGSCRVEQAELKQVHELVSDLGDPAVEPPDDNVIWQKVDSALGDEKPGDQVPFDREEEDIVASGVFDIKEMVAKPAAASGGAMGEGSLADNGAAAGDFFGLGSSDSGPIDAVPTGVAPPPVLMPVAQRPSWLVPVFVAGGVLVLSVLALGFILFVGEGRKQKSSKEEVAQAPPPGESAAAKSKEPSPGSQPMQPAADPGKAAEKPSEAPAGTGAAGTGAADMAPEDPVKPTATGTPLAALNGAAESKSRGRGGRHRRTRGHAPARGSVSSRPASSGIFRRARTRGSGGGGAAAAKPRKTFSDDPLSALLGKSRARPRAARPDPRTAGLPAHLGRSQIRQVMGKAAGAVKRCFETHKMPGLMRVAIAIKGSTGRISSVSVRGKFKGTATARCALRAIRRLRFPKFSNPTQRFTYPFLLR